MSAMRPFGNDDGQFQTELGMSRDEHATEHSINVLTEISLQTSRKAILTMAIVFAMLQIIGAEIIGATDIVLDANGNRVEHHRT